MLLQGFLSLAKPPEPIHLSVRRALSAPLLRPLLLLHALQQRWGCTCPAFLLCSPLCPHPSAFCFSPCLCVPSRFRSPASRRPVLCKTQYRPVLCKFANSNRYVQRWPRQSGAIAAFEVWRHSSVVAMFGTESPVHAEAQGKNRAAQLADVAAKSAADWAVFAFVFAALECFLQFKFVCFPFFRIFITSTVLLTFFALLAFHHH